MKKTLPFVLLIISVLGCNKFGPDTTSTSNSNSANAKASPAEIKKIVDLPATIGKTPDEIKKMISETPAKEEPWLEYSLPQADLTFKFDKGKNYWSTFQFKTIGFGDASISGTETAEQIGTMAGVDIKGKTPKSTGLADTYEIEINGKKANVDFYRSGNTYHQIMIKLN